MSRLFGFIKEHLPPREWSGEPFCDLPPQARAWFLSYLCPDIIVDQNMYIKWQPFLRIPFPAALLHQTRCPPLPPCSPRHYRTPSANSAAPPFWPQDRTQQP